MAAVTASANNATGTFMFHPRPTVFEHPITYDLPSTTNSTSIVTKTSNTDDFSQYYISELYFRIYFFVVFFNLFLIYNRIRIRMLFRLIALESRTTIQKSAKGPISIAECDSQGKSVTVENTSRSKSMVLTGWTIRQQSESGETLTYTFPDNCLLRPNHSIKILTKPNESERKSTDLIASSLSSWHTGLNFITTLINAEGKDRASLTKKTIFS
ncbi:unnamed protein product [Rotaria socialis]|uniref:LTD domain-containing protein n=1 Tax=Rotaria socialis TaxID=392032 RepID=A0A819XP22_9BILA|nr:unnamed protein product [Rotaria socialis]